ncbi:MAG TPA: chlorite dismutase family protein [Polyangiales bacterium]|nr:chlorite dismutase family protein [Polyangiales bacterium]
MSTPQHDNSDIDVNERGAEVDGRPQVMNRRLFMQLLVFETRGELGAADAAQNLQAALERRKIACVLYADVNSPNGLAVLSWSEDPNYFVTQLRPALQAPELHGLKQMRELTMLGRTYSSGYENDLQYWLLDRPRETALNEAWPWAVWYPLRRGGAFEKLEGREKAGILREHAGIGKAYGAADLAHDIRLACHGLDANDNEFVIGLIGKDLHPLSHVVQAMRKTRQTAEFIVQMGPFFVGRALYRSAGA